ncbi:hypothetical protein PT095_08940, partial [Erysipelothrix rhusiopathiae]|nr:hypothetical protein [Erysipelothrix rhusiopathiae]
KEIGKGTVDSEGNFKEIGKGAVESDGVFSVRTYGVLKARALIPNTVLTNGPAGTPVNKPGSGETNVTGKGT